MNLCALVLAAGEGSRLRPLTRTLPKALCPVGNVALLDRALHRLARHGLAGPTTVAVNACHLADKVRAHTGDRAHISLEPGPPALGTAGAVAHLREWTAGRAVLVGNADAYLAPDVDGRDLAALLEGWDGHRVRVLVVPGGDEFAGGTRFAGFSLLPPDVVAELGRGRSATAGSPRRSDLVSQVWRPAEREGRLELVTYPGFYLDTGTPRDYLAANLHAAGGGDLVAPDADVRAPLTNAVVGSGATVHGPVTRSVVLPGAWVGPEERLFDSIRQGHDVTITTGSSS